jgi:type I restriction enzyme R subunit
VALDHYSCYGIDELEEAKTYSAPQFNQFGNFSEIAKSYGGAANLKSDLESIKSRLYVPMNSVA